MKWSEVAQSCPTLFDPMDSSQPGSSIHGIFQAKILECVAISFSRGSSWPRDRIWVSCIVGRRFTVWATRGVSKLYNVCLYIHTQLPWWLSSKEFTCQCKETQVWCLGWKDKIPWRRKWKPILVFFSGKSHRQRSLEGHSSWGHKGSDTT